MIRNEKVRNDTPVEIQGLSNISRYNDILGLDLIRL